MEQEILQKLQLQEIKLEAIHKDLRQIHGFIKWTVIGSIILFILPLLGMLFAIPAFIKALSATSGLGF